MAFTRDVRDAIISTSWCRNAISANVCRVVTWLRRTSAIHLHNYAETSRWQAKLKN